MDTREVAAAVKGVIAATMGVAVDTRVCERNKPRT